MDVYVSIVLHACPCLYVCTYGEQERPDPLDLARPVRNHRGSRQKTRSFLGNASENPRNLNTHMRLASHVATQLRWLGVPVRDTHRDQDGSDGSHARRGAARVSHGGLQHRATTDRPGWSESARLVRWGLRRPLPSPLARSAQEGANAVVICYAMAEKASSLGGLAVSAGGLLCLSRWGAGDASWRSGLQLSPSARLSMWSSSPFALCCALSHNARTYVPADALSRCHPARATAGAGCLTR